MTCRNISGAILAGGKAARMGGKNKAFLKVNGVPIIQRTVSLFDDLFEEVIIVTNSPEEYTSYEKEALIVSDIVKGIGPLGGIHSGLAHASKESVFFVACDMPNLHNDIVHRQIAYFAQTECDVLVPKVGPFIEPLHAIYKKSLKDNLGSFIQKSNNRSVRDFLQTVKVCYWNLEDNAFHRKIFKNINVPDDLRG